MEYIVKVKFQDKQEMELLDALKSVHQPLDKEKTQDYISRLVKTLLINAAHEGLMRRAAQRMTLPGITT